MIKPLFTNISYSLANKKWQVLFPLFGRNSKKGAFLAIFENKEYIISTHSSIASSVNRMKPK